MSDTNASAARSGAEARSARRICAKDVSRFGRLPQSCWQQSWPGGAMIVATHFAPLVVFPATVGAVLAAELVSAAGPGLPRPAPLAEPARRHDRGRSGTRGGRALFQLSGEQKTRAVITHPQVRFCTHAFPELQSRLEVRDGTFLQFLDDSANRGTELCGTSPEFARRVAAVGIRCRDHDRRRDSVCPRCARRPYCDACGSWFRICRGGPIDTATAEALLSAAALSDRPAGDASYRIWSCRSGCGPTGFELSWK